MNLRMAPIDFRDGKPVDEHLYQEVQDYAEKEFGAPLIFAYYNRLWGALAVEESGEYKVIGVIGVRNAIDVPTFHVTPPSNDREGFKIAEQARDMMVYRCWSYLQDLGNTGNVALIYVSETAQRFWRKFLKKIGAKSACRYEVKI